MNEIVEKSPKAMTNFAKAVDGKN